jgi:hypothetical protein
MREVTIYDLGDPARRRTIYADSGDLRVATNRRDLDLTLFHGTIQTIPASDPAQLQRLFYTTSNFRVRDVLNSLDRSGATAGMKGDREMGVCEMQAQIDRAGEAQRAAQSDLRTLLVTAAREAVDGAAAAPAAPVATPAAAPGKGSPGLGRAYCGALGAAVTAFGGKPSPAGTAPTRTARRWAGSTRRGSSPPPSRACAPASTTAARR